MTFKEFYLISMQFQKFALCEKYKIKLHLLIKQIVNFSVKEALFI